MNCCHNSRLIVDEEDLEWVASEKKLLLLLKQFHKKYCSKIPRSTKLSHSTYMQKHTLMHRGSMNDKVLITFIAVFYPFDLFLQTRKFEEERSTCTSIQFARLTNVLIQIVQLHLIFIHLKLWFMVAGHNFKWGKLSIC